MRGTGKHPLARLGLLIAILGAGALGTARDMAANTPIVVNSTDEGHDANPGDGICEKVAGNGVCTLRAAIEEAEALSGADTITFSASLPDPAIFLLSLGHLQISTDLTITGKNAGSTVIDGQGTVTNDRVFLMTNAVSTFNVTISRVMIESGNAIPVNDGFGGGGIEFRSFLGGHLLLSEVTLSNNAAGGGGGLDFTGTATLDHCTVSHNAATYFGGGIQVNGLLTLTSSTIEGNSASHGGGLSNPGTARLAGNTVTGNMATIDGGGLYNSGILDVINTTVTANSGPNGAGIYVYGFAGSPGLSSVRAYNATITQNGCGFGGTGCGIDVATDGSATITNTVLAQNYTTGKFGLVPEDCNAVASGDYNLIQTTAGCTITGATSNNVTGDPNLGPLQDNGGPTRTLALLSGSPAIDAGNPSGCRDNLSSLLTADQRGFVRPVNGRCDMGAYEYAPPAQFYTLTPCRAVDTRNGDAPALVAGADREFALTGKCLIPSGARAVSLNVTVVAGTSAGDLRVYPAGTPRPSVSSINFATGQTRANNAVATLSGSGAVAIHDDQSVGTSVQIILDVNGYFQ